jgi:hypothetical protein
VPFKIKNDGGRRLRLRLATWIAPAGVDVRDTTTTVCACRLDLLEAVFFGQIQVGPYSMLVSAEDAILELHDAGLIDFYEDRPLLTDQGERQLDRLWGRDKVPPWYTIGIASCHDHGDFDAHPGDPIDCPRCPVSKVEKRRRWWSPIR